MDHHDHIKSDGPFAAGWLWALVAAVVSAVLARWFGAPITGAVLIALGIFVIYAVLLAQFWEAPASGDHDHGHGHDAHDHGHAAPAAVAAESKPAGLAGPRGGTADALQEIEGIGPALEKLAHELGIFHFDQIAGWGSAEIAWMDSNLKGFKGRVTRDKWVAQARIILAEGVEAFRIRAKTNDY